MFEPLPRRPTAVEACAATLRKGLVRRELAAGSRLPPERELAEQLGVNRTTLRAALHELAADGLLEVRQGSGHRVRDLDVAGGPDLVPTLVEVAREEGGLREVCGDLLQIRRALAGALFDRLAGGAPEASLAGVEAAIDAMAACPPDPDALALADLGVVRAWVRCAGSRVLGWFVQPIAGILAGLPELAAAMYARPEENVAGWRALLAAVRARDLDRAAFVALLEARDRATLATLAPPEAP